ncbi:MAG: hypothetical protein IKC83_01135, partial [Clostridia bacterium]|nr:hypothetical protein [Clostridia bacterium]
MMRKQNKNRFFRLSALLVLILALSFTLIACAPENPGDGDGETETPVTETVLDVKNGNFEYVTGTDYPKAPKNWTFTTGYTLSSTDSVHVYNGVIKVTDDAYNLYSEKYHTSANPGQAGEDDYVLMINNAEYYSASYTSESITFKKGKYYALTVSVKTALSEGNESGAYIMLENDGNTRTYLSFDKIQDKDWTTYTFWIEASKSASNTAKLVLTNGDGGKTSGDLSKGEVFFDSAVLTEKTKTEYENATKDSDSKTECYTFALRNANFTETSSDTLSDKPVTPYDWTSYVGRDDNGSNIAPTVGLSRGVIDTKSYVPSVGILAEKDGDDFKYPITNSTTDQNADSNVLMIYLSNQTSPSAYSYYSNSITFEYDKIYKLSFDVRTVGLKGIDENKNVVDTTNGVTVKLGEDDVLFENKNTNGEWTTFTAYVYGSATQSKSLPLYFWLGQGHAEDKDGFVSGAAFFDNITLTEITEVPGTIDPDVEYVFEGFNTTNLIDSTTFGKLTDSANWTWDYDEEKHGDAPDCVVGAIDLDDYDTAKETLKLNASNPGKAMENRDNNDKAIVFANRKPGATWTTLSDEIKIKVNQNLSYRLSFWVKTAGIKSGSGATIALINKSDDEDAQLTTLSSINTETFDEDGKVDGNEWKEIVFYVQGNQIKDKTVSLKLSLGSGNMYNPSYLAGEVFISNFYYEKVEYKEYNSASTGDTVAKYSFRSTESVKITNGNFNNIDIDKSEKAHAINPVTGILTAPAVAQNWTASKETGAKAGVITKAVFDTVKSSFTADTFNNPFFDDENSPNKYNGAPFMLMIYTGTADKFSYTSPSMSLTAKTYYKVTANVNVKDGKAVVEMINGDHVERFEITSTGAENNGWKTYTFYVKVGL